MNLVTRTAWLPVRAECPGPIWSDLRPASLIAVGLTLSPGQPLNRDGMLWPGAARAFVEGGLPAAIGVFPGPSWPSHVTPNRSPPWPPENGAGHALNLLFMSGACALMIKPLIRAKCLSWLAGASILAPAGLNGLPQ